MPTAVQDIRNPGQVLEAFEDFPLAVQPIHCVCPVQIETGVGTRLLDNYGCIAVSAEIHASGVRVSERTVDREGQRDLACRRDFLEPGFQDIRDRSPTRNREGQRPVIWYGISVGVTQVSIWHSSVYRVRTKEPIAEIDRCLCPPPVGENVGAFQPGEATLQPAQKMRKLFLGREERYELPRVAAIAILAVSPKELVLVRQVFKSYAEVDCDGRRGVEDLLSLAGASADVNLPPLSREFGTRGRVEHPVGRPFYVPADRYSDGEWAAGFL